MKQLLSMLMAVTAPDAQPSIQDVDLLRFPHPEVICRHRELAARNLQRARERRSMDSRWQTSEAVEQCKFHFVIWDTLQAASNERGESRKNALGALRHLIGPLSYYQGNVPPTDASFWSPDDSVRHVSGPLR